MARWALTGGIASGKSTVASLFMGHHIPVIDADAVYHSLLVPADDKPSPLVEAITRSFPFALGAHHTLDRRALGAHVFAHPEARRTLEEITHPAVQAEVEHRFTALEAQGHKLVLYDVPLLFERGLQHKFAGVILVWVPAQMQLQRLMARDKLDEEAAHRRLQSQGSLDAKRPLSDHVIDNSQSLPSTQKQVERILAELAR